MSLEGTIRDLGLQEVGQLLSLSRKSGTLSVHSVLRGARAWIRFVDGAIVDAGCGAPPPADVATEAAASGSRSDIEEAALEVLTWREGHFAFAPLDTAAGSASRVRIPTDAMLVESANREHVWNGLRDRIASADAVPSFVDVEPKALPLLRLQPQEWEVLTRVDGARSVRVLARLMKRDLLEIASVVHGLIGTGLLVIGDASQPSASTPSSFAPVPGADDIREASEELWIPAHAEMAVFAADTDNNDVVFDPIHAGLLTPHGSPLVPFPEPEPEPERNSARGTANGAASAPMLASGTNGMSPEGVSVTLPAIGEVASEGAKPSFTQNGGRGTVEGVTDVNDWRREGDAAARRGDFEQALSCWSRHLRTPQANADADRVREAIGLAARLQALLYPMT